MADEAPRSPHFLTAGLGAAGLLLLALSAPMRPGDIIRKNAQLDAKLVAPGDVIRVEAGDGFAGPDAGDSLVWTADGPDPVAGAPRADGGRYVELTLKDDASLAGRDFKGTLVMNAADISGKDLSQRRGVSFHVTSRLGRWRGLGALALLLAGMGLCALALYRLVLLGR